MKIIKIMKEASEKIRDEKLEFTNLMEHLNEVLEPRGIELERIEWSPKEAGSFEEFKEKHKDCKMCLDLYRRDLAGNSGQEHDSAYHELNVGNNPRKLYVFFKVPANNASKELVSFKENFYNNYHIIPTSFNNMDSWCK